MDPEILTILALWEEMCHRHKVWESLQNKQPQKSEATLELTLFAAEQT